MIMTISQAKHFLLSVRLVSAVWVSGAIFKILPKSTAEETDSTDNTMVTCCAGRKLSDEGLTLDT